MDETDGTCSVAKLGELLNLSPRRIQQLAKDGVFPKDDRGQYDLAGAVRGYGRYLQEQTLREGDDPDLLEAKRRLEIIKVQERRHRVQQMRRSLIDRAQAAELVTRLAREDRERWATWPSRVASGLAADLGVDAAAMRIVLESHVREHLGELAESKPGFR